MQTAPNTPNKWLVTITVVFGSFMAALDSTIVNISIPQMQSSFGVGIHNVQWVVTAYLLTMGAVTPLTSYLANNFGPKRSYIGSLLIFTVGSLLCGLSWDLPSLVIFRVLQGIGGAALLPLAMTITINAFPREQRGTAVATLGAPTLLAPVLGPVLGGYIVTYADWSYIFFINIPVGVVGLILSWFVLRNVVTEKRSSFDLAGFLAIAYGAVATIYAVSIVSEEGWGSLKVLLTLGSGLLALAAFVVRELRLANRGEIPLLDLRLFRYRAFSVGSFALIIYVVALFGSTFLIPIYLQEVRGQSAFDAGTTMMFQAVTALIFSQIGGRLVDHIGGRTVVLIGLTALGLTTWLLAGLQLATSLGWLEVTLALRGIGLGMVSQPLIATAMGDMHSLHDTADATTIITVFRNIFASIGVAVIATLVQSGTRSHLQQLTASGFTGTAAKVQAQLLAMQDVLILSVFLIVGAIVAVFFLPARRGQPTKQAAVQVETAPELAAPSPAAAETDIAELVKLK